MLTLLLMSQPAISVMFNTISGKEYVMDLVIYGNTYHYQIHLIP